jgi:hypothetical protein
MIKHLWTHRFLLSFTIIFLFVSAGLAEAQDENQGVRRLSITLNGGVTYGSAGNISGPFAGKFNVASFRQSVYGGSVQYAFNPAWSLETAVQIGGFENQFESDPAFKNDYLHVSVKGLASMNDLLSLKWGAARFINPHFAIGLGMIKSDVQAVGLDSQDLSLMFTGDAGLSFYIFQGADLFVKYSYYAVGGDLLDGLSGDGGSDHFAALTTGLRFNFGKRNTNLASWPVPRIRSVPTPAAEPLAQNREQDPAPDTQQTNEIESVPEEELISEPADILTAEDKVENETDSEWLNSLSEFLASPMLKQPLYISEAMTRAEENAKRFEQERIQRQTEADARAAEEALARTDEMAKEQEQERTEAEARQRRNERGIVTNRPEAGHYIQISSFLSSASANRIRNELVESIKGEIDNPSQRVLIHQFEDFNRVIIGPFGRFSEGQSLLRNLMELYPEAFLITFPRDK